MLERLHAVYERFLVSHRGAYSVERVLAFDDYCTQTSTLRAVLVCVLFPIPALALMLIIEAIPLDDPKIGWRLSYTFWIRLSASIVAITASFLQLALASTPELPMSALKQLSVCVVSAAVYLGYLVLMANFWDFPIPFMTPIGAGPCIIIFMVTWVVFTGITRLKSVPGLQERALALGRLMSVFALLCFAYPVYNAIFVSLEGSPLVQNAVVLLLPLLRLALRNIAANACAFWEDIMPETTIFSVEVFNSMYLAQSMQSSNSIAVTALVVGSDLILSVYTLHNLNAKAQEIKRLRLAAEEKHRASSSEDFSYRSMQTLVKALTTEGIDFKRIRVFGSFSHTATTYADRVKLLRSISRKARVTTDRFAATRSIGKTVHKSPISVTAVMPQSPTKLSHAREQRTAWVEKSLRLLFQCEYVVLAEYVESIVSATSVVHLAVMFELPNLQYYPHQASIPTTQRPTLLLRLTVFAAIEFASLVFVQLRIQRSLGFSTVHLLAFVLETQLKIALGKFVLWVDVVYQFTLVHYGSDFPALLRWAKSAI